MSIRILVAEDDTERRRIYGAHFSSSDCLVDVASSLREARIRLASGSYDAVILNLCLGDDAADGLVLAEDVTRLRTARPLLVMTAYGEPIFGRVAARLGADLFLHKPVSLAWLERLLRGWVSDRRMTLPVASAS